MLARQKRFLEAFSEWPTVRSAATKARISRTTHHNWLERDPKYARTFAELEEDLIQVAEAECYRRAVKGIERPVFQGGTQVGTVTDYSDSVLMFLLKARRPEVYRERRDVRHQVDDRNDWAALIRASRQLGGE